MIFISSEKAYAP